jgi:Ulp1 family protease
MQAYMFLIILFTVMQVPRQKNGNDCGVFVIEYAKAITEGVMFTQYHSKPGLSDNNF